MASNGVANPHALSPHPTACMSVSTNSPFKKLKNTFSATTTAKVLDWLYLAFDSPDAVVRSQDRYCSEQFDFGERGENLFFNFYFREQSFLLVGGGV